MRIINRPNRGLNDHDIKELVGNSQNFQKLIIRICHNNTDSNNITQRGVEVLAEYQWNYLTYIDLSISQIIQVVNKTIRHQHNRQQGLQSTNNSRHSPITNTLAK